MPPGRAVTSGSKTRGGDGCGDSGAVIADFDDHATRFGAGTRRDCRSARGAGLDRVLVEHVEKPCEQPGVGPHAHVVGLERVVPGRAPGGEVRASRHDDLD